MKKELTKLFIIIVLSLITLTSVQAEKSLAVGAGVGIPYGVVGINISYTVNEKIDVMAGLGTTIFAGMATSLGMRFYPSREKSGLRFIAVYGTNAVFQGAASCSVCQEFESGKGMNIGIGWDWSKPDGGWDLDIMYILTSDAFDKVDKLKREGRELSGDSEPGIKLSGGYHW